MDPMEIDSANPEIPWELDDLLGKGRFATAFIPRGTRIMAWKPPIVIEPPTTDPNLTSYLPMNSGGSIQREVAWNFLNATSISHACDNNAHHAWNSNIQCITLHAIRDIHEGDEITTNYLSPLICLPSDARRKLIHEQFKFWCHCRLCSLPEALTREVDRLLDKVQEIREAILKIGPYLSITGPANLHAEVYQIIRYFLALTNEQGVNNNDLANVYLVASIVMFAAGDLARGSVYIRRAVNEFIVYEGHDSPVVQQNWMIIDRLTRPPSSLVDELLGTVKPTNMDDLPTGLTPQLMNHWLWDPVPTICDLELFKPNHGPLSEYELSPQSSPSSHRAASPGISSGSGVYITVQPDVVTDLRNMVTFPTFRGLPHEMGLHLSPFHVSTGPRRIIMRTDRRVGGEVTRACSRPGAANPKNRRSGTASRRAGKRGRSAGSPASSKTISGRSGSESCSGSGSPGTASQPTPVAAGTNPGIGISQPTTRQFLAQLQRSDETRAAYRLKAHYALIGEINAVVNLSRLELYVKDLSGKQFPLSFWTSRKGVEFSQDELNVCVGQAIVLLYPVRSTSVFRFRAEGVKVWDMKMVKVWFSFPFFSFDFTRLLLFTLWIGSVD